MCQRELGQFFGKVARWANRLYKSDSEVNLFEQDSEFDPAQKFFQFFLEDQEAMIVLGDTRELLKANADADAAEEEPEPEPRARQVSFAQGDQPHEHEDEQHQREQEEEERAEAAPTEPTALVQRAPSPTDRRQAVELGVPTPRDFVLMVLPNEHVRANKKLKLQASTVEELGAKVGEAVGLEEAGAVCAPAEDVSAAAPYGSLDEVSGKAKVMVWPASRFADAELDE
eukprot:COSAG04_NODE_6582_length_1299_cov_22.675833_2_plen_227_part_01